MSELDSVKIGDIFEVGECTGVSWVTGRPTTAEHAWTDKWPVPELLCEFRIGDKYTLPVFAIFDKEHYCHSYFFHSDLEGMGDIRHIANAIAEIRTFQHFGFEAKADAHEIASHMHAATVALYKYNNKLRAGFPLLAQYFGGQLPNGGHVYLLDDQQGHYKIGRSVDVTGRVKQLRTQPPFEIEILAHAWMPDCKAEEKRLHDEYRQHRLRGEWFALPDDEVRYTTSYLRNRSGLYGKMRRLFLAGDLRQWRERDHPFFYWYYSPEEVTKTREALAPGRDA